MEKREIRREIKSAVPLLTLTLYKPVKAAVSLKVRYGKLISPLLGKDCRTLLS